MFYGFGNYSALRWLRTFSAIKEMLATQFINTIFNTVYWKVLVVLILATLITFVHEIQAFKDGVIVYLIFIILAMIVWVKEDIGFVILLCALFVLAYNNVRRKNKAQHFYS